MYDIVHTSVRQSKLKRSIPQRSFALLRSKEIVNGCGEIGKHTSPSLPSPYVSSLFAPSLSLSPSLSPLSPLFLPPSLSLSRSALSYRDTLGRRSLPHARGSAVCPHSSLSVEITVENRDRSQSFKFREGLAREEGLARAPMGATLIPLAALFSLVPLGVAVYGFYLWCLCLRAAQSARECFLCRDRVPREQWKAHLEKCLNEKEHYIKALPETVVKTRRS